jgi:predicted flap endonuclease-1-like 5' DNA nuclease
MDDDADGWNDTDEIDCGTEPLNATSVPEDVNDNGVCDVNDEPEVEVEGEPEVEDEPEDNLPQDSDLGMNQYLSWTACCIFLLLLLLLLLVLLRGNNKSVMSLIHKYRDAEPEHTTSKPVFVFGVGTREDPFMLEPIENSACGSSVESKELITIDNLDSGSIIRFNDLNDKENDGRFRMESIEVRSEDDEGNSSIRFRLKFDDSRGYESTGGSDYEGLIKVGTSSVYLLWNVKTKESSSDRKARQKADADARKAEKNRIRKEAKDEALAEAAAEAKKEKKMRAEVEEKLRAEAESKTKIEAKAKFEAEAKVKAETELKAKKAAEEKARAERKASKEAAALAQSDAEQRLAKMEEQMAAKMEEMEKKMEGLSKKEAELARISAKAEFIDFKTLGVAKSSEKDDLKKMKGVGPFIEEKLNALGIYTFLQISKMTPEIEEQVNIAIEFFRGRVRRDKWVLQATKLHEKKE